MTASWYLVKYVPDMRRREPRNVGVILQTPDGWLTRFLGEEADGSINGRHLPHSFIKTDVYKTWVSYFRRKASNEAWSDVDRMQKRRVANYFAELGGRFVRDEPEWSAALERLFAELVEAGASKPKEPKSTPLDQLLVQVDRVLDVAGIAPQRKVWVPAKFGADAAVTEVPFRFAFENGQHHLMDVVHEHATPDKAAADARELRARVDAARLAGSATSFLTFFASSILDVSNLDQVMSPVEQVSETVDVDNVEQAVEKVQALMGH